MKKFTDHLHLAAKLYFFICVMMFVFGFTLTLLKYFTS